MQARYMLVNDSYYLGFSFSTEKLAKEAIPAVTRYLKSRGLKRVALEVREVKSVSAREFDNFIKVTENMAATEEAKRQGEKAHNRMVREHVNKHPDEYWNSKEQAFKKVPTPVWSQTEPDGGWWRHVTVEMFEADKDYYLAWFRELNGGVAQQVAYRAPDLLGKYLEESRHETSYEKSLKEGYAININDVGGFNRFSVEAVKESEREPVRTSYRKGEGLNGILAPDGVWYACNYQGHANLVQWLQEKTKYRDAGDAYWDRDSDADIDQFIIFSHSRSVLDGSTISVCYSHGANITKGSQEWLKKMVDYMSEEQLTYMENILNRFKERQEEAKE